MRSFFYVFITGLATLFFINSINSCAQATTKTPFWNPDRYLDDNIPRVYINLGVTPYNSYLRKYWDMRNSILPNHQLGLNFDLNKIGFCFQYNFRQETAHQLPENYSASNKFLSNRPFVPQDCMRELTVALKRFFYTKHKELQFFSQAGFSIMNVLKAEQFIFQPTSSGILFSGRSANYSYTNSNIGYIGLLIGGGVNLPLSQVLGVTSRVAATIVDKKNSYFSLEFDINVGYLRKKFQHE